MDYEWKVHDDLCGSDHFPLFLNNIASGFEEPTEKWKYFCGNDHFPLFLNNIASGFEEPTEKWKLNKADWPSFKALCKSEINGTILETKDPIENFTTFLYDIAPRAGPGVELARRPPLAKSVRI